MEMRFLRSYPYATVAGEGQFTPFASVRVPSIPANGEAVRCVLWTPEATDTVTHGCLKVEVHGLYADGDDTDNDAQQNVEVQASSHGSPYDAVHYPFQVRNAGTKDQLIYFQAEGIPEEWAQSLWPQKMLLAPGDDVFGYLDLKPHEGAPDCRDHRIHVTAWTPRGDTLVKLGGATLDMPLRRHTKTTLKVEPKACDPKQGGNLKYCQLLVASGCTSPVRKGEKLSVGFLDPAGNPNYRAVLTDDAGCFSASFQTGEGGTWRTTVDYPGDKCSGPVHAETKLSVQFPMTGDQDGDGLPDKDEVQGDWDGDGLPGPLDPDSDNDQVLDGKEAPGDKDQDGRPNVVDADS